jgi:type II secretory pathway component PulF
MAPPPVVAVVSAPAPAVPQRRRATRRAAARRDLAALCRYGALAVRASHPLPAALRSIAPELAWEGSRRAVLDVAVRMEAGSSLSAALDVHPEVFDEFFVSAVRAGERSGNLARAFDLLREWIDDTQDVTEGVRTALMYPLTVCAISALVLLFLCFKVVPTFADVYTSIGGRLPLPTRIVFGLSGLLVNWALLWIPAVVAAGAGAWMVGRSRPGALANALNGVPLFGPMLQAASLCRFAGTLRLLLESGIPAAEALKVSAGVSGPVFGPALREVATQVERGVGFAKALKDSGSFPPLFGWFIESAEGAGKLEAGLGDAAEAYGAQARALGRAIPTVLEPLFLLAVSAIVGIIVIGMFYPLFAMGSMAGG